MTNQQRNKQHLKEMAESVEQRQKASKERHEKISGGLARSNSEYDIDEMTNTANGLLSGEIKPDELGIDGAIEFTNQCNTAIGSLEKKLLDERTTAGFLLQQGKIDAYKGKQEEVENIESKISLFKTFI